VITRAGRWPALRDRSLILSGVLLLADDAGAISRPSGRQGTLLFFRDRAVAHDRSDVIRAADGFHNRRRRA